MARRYRSYSRDFKLEAVRLAEEEDRSVKEVAEQLGIHFGLLYQWLKKYRKENEEAFPGRGKVMSKDEELRQLKRDNARLREERDILKKAITFFAKESK